MAADGKRGLLARAAGVAAIVLLTAGCGAFSADTTTTDQATTTENAANAVLGPIRIDDAYIAAPTPAHPVLHLSLANEGTTQDRLLAVSVGSPAPTGGAPAATSGLPLSLGAGAFADLDRPSTGIPLRPTRPAAVDAADLPVHLQFAVAAGVTLDLPVVARAP